MNQRELRLQLLAKRPFSSLVVGILLLGLSSLPNLVAEASATTFVVKEGAFPWMDRGYTWQLTDVPDSASSNSPLPQQHCTDQTIIIPSKATHLFWGVANQDMEKFEIKGDSISVIQTGGSEQIGNTLFKLPHPSSHVGDSPLLAGLILLKINHKPPFEFRK